MEEAKQDSEGTDAGGRGERNGKRLAEGYSRWQVTPGMTPGKDESIVWRSRINVFLKQGFPRMWAQAPIGSLKPIAKNGKCTCHTTGRQGHEHRWELTTASSNQFCTRAAHCASGSLVPPSSPPLLPSSTSSFPPVYTLASLL